MSRSGLLTIVVKAPPARYPDDGWGVIEIEGNEERVSPNSLNDVEWARNSISDSGGPEHFLFDEDDIYKEFGKKIKLFKITGYIVGEWCESYDYGRDYDECFEIESIEPYHKKKVQILDLTPNPEGYPENSPYFKKESAKVLKSRKNPLWDDEGDL